MRLYQITCSVLFLLVSAPVLAESPDLSQQWQTCHQSVSTAIKEGKIKYAIEVEKEFLEQAQAANQPHYALYSLSELAFLQRQDGQVKEAKQSFAELSELLPFVEQSPRDAKLLSQSMDAGCELCDETGDSRSKLVFQRVSADALHIYYLRGQRLPWVYIAGAIIALGLVVQRLRLKASQNQSAPQSVLKVAVRAFVCWLLAGLPLALSSSIAQVGHLAGSPYSMAVIILFGCLVWKIRPIWLAVVLWLVIFILASMSSYTLTVLAKDTGGNYFVFFMSFWLLFYFKGPIRLIKKKEKVVSAPEN